VIKNCILITLFAILFFVCMELGWQTYKLFHQPKPFPPPDILSMWGDDRNKIDRKIYAHDNCIEWNRGRKKPAEKWCHIEVERVEF